MNLHSLPSAMFATLGGLLALPLGLAVLLLPLLATELSRPRDSFWGAVVLLQGLVLVTTADRLSGAPMLAVLCGALLLGRLALEVGQARWRQLTPEEQQRLGSWERWSTSLRQLGATLSGLGNGALTAVAGLRAAGVSATSAGAGRAKGKRWVRPEAPPPESPVSSPPEPPDQEEAAAEAPAVAAAEEAPGAAAEEASGAAAEEAPGAAASPGAVEAG